MPSIFGVSLKNIRLTLELFEEYDIGQYVTNRCLRRKASLQRILLEYLVDNDIDLVIINKNDEYVLNPIINASKSELMKKYNIDIKNLENQVKKKCLE